MTDVQVESERRVGRPRSPEVDEAILDAAVEAFVDHGLDGLSVDDVAARAGVGKATIYRRYACKVDLVVAAARRCCEQQPHGAETGDLDVDLRAVAHALAVMLDRSIAGRAIPRMVAESSRQPEMRDAQRDFVGRRRAHTIALVERAIERGDLRADTDPAVLVDMISGPLFYRHLVTGEHTDAAYVDRLVDSVLRGFAR
ncbi:MAG TPA: TetR/AcrR family transcriptional regulator [Acidimicrobiia bacterium]|nr:TetR/AcrR family transcriptional regulator [Acidimicrobiia bacterium]